MPCISGRSASSTTGISPSHQCTRQRNFARMQVTPAWRVDASKGEKQTVQVHCVLRFLSVFISSFLFSSGIEVQMSKHPLMCPADALEDNASFLAVALAIV